VRTEGLNESPMYGRILGCRPKPAATGLARTYRCAGKMTLPFLLRLARACANALRDHALVSRQFTRDGLPAAASDVAGEHARFKQS
jgi:hypothetical protein